MFFKGLWRPAAVLGIVAGLAFAGLRSATRAPGVNAFPKDARDGLPKTAAPGVNAFPKDARDGLPKTAAPGDPPRLGRLPDFQAEAATTRAFSSAELIGRPWVADFIFTSCAGPCPLLSSQMARLQARLPREVRLASFTVDPERDGPEVLRAYAARFGADPERWVFLNAGREGLARLLRDGFKLAAVRDPAAPSGLRVTHSTKLVLVDARAEIRGYYDGGDAAAFERLVRDARVLVAGSDK